MMKQQVTVNPELLAGALKKLSPAVNNNSVLPITESVKISVKKDHIVLTATNLSKTLVNKVEATSNVEFEMLCMFSELLKIASVLFIPMIITLDAKKITIESGFDNYELGKAEDVAQFPSLPEMDNPYELDLTGDMIQSMVAAAKLADPKDYRFANICLHFQGNKMSVVGLTGQYMYIKSFEIEKAFDKELKVLIPFDYMPTIADIPAAKVYFTNRNICTEYADLKSIIVLSENSFPGYEQILNAYHPIFENHFNFTSFRNALNKLTVFQSLVSTVGLNLSKDGIELEFNDPNTARQSKTNIDAIMQTTLNRIAFNIPTLNRALSTLPKSVDELEFSATANNKPAYFRPKSDEHCKVLVMPTI